MTPVADVFLEIPTPENMFRYMSKKPCFRVPFERQQSKWVKTLFQSEWQYVYNNHFEGSFKGKSLF